MFGSFERGGTFWMGVVVVFAGMVRIAQIGYNREMATRRSPLFDDDDGGSDDEKDDEDEDDDEEDLVFVGKKEESKKTR